MDNEQESNAERLERIRERQEDRAKWSNWAIAGLALGISGFMCLPVVGGIIGIVFAVIAKNEGDERHAKYALWTSIASAGAWILYFLGVAVYMLISMGIAASQW